MKILINEINGPSNYEGWFIRENETGFWVYLFADSDIEIKFPSQLYSYKTINE